MTGGVSPSKLLDKLSFILFVILQRYFY